VDIHIVMSSLKSPKTPTAKQDFKTRLKSAKKSGSTVKSDMKNSAGRVVQFEDGASLRLLKTGHMVHNFPDGSKVQRNPDGAEIKVDNEGMTRQQNPNGNLVVKHLDGTTVTHVAETGQKVFVYPDGTTKEVDGVKAVVAPKDKLKESTSKPKTPKKFFNELLRDEKKNGKKVVSDKRKKSHRFVEFNDGSELRLFNSGLLVHDYPDGTKYQRNADGTGITIQTDGTKVQKNPNGNTVYQYMDGTQVTHVASTGEKIYVYPDGSTKQMDADGGGIIVNKDGQRSDFNEGGDIAFEKKRLAKAKEPLDESLENRASSTEEGNADIGGAIKERNNFWSTLVAERATRKIKEKVKEKFLLRNGQKKDKVKVNGQKKGNCRRMVPQVQPQQATAAQADNGVTDFQIGSGVVEAERLQRDNLMNQALLGSDAYDADSNDPERICCWMDATSKSGADDNDRVCEECTIM